MCRGLERQSRKPCRLARDERLAPETLSFDYSAGMASPSESPSHQPAGRQPATGDPGRKATDGRALTAALPNAVSIDLWSHRPRRWTSAWFMRLRRGQGRFTASSAGGFRPPRLRRRGYRSHVAGLAIGWEGIARRPMETRFAPPLQWPAACRSSECTLLSKSKPPTRRLRHLPTPKAQLGWRLA